MIKDAYTNNYMKIREADYVKKSLETGVIGKQI